MFNRVIELLEAEWRIATCNACIERQRQLIERLGSQGQDTTPAQNVFDSLLVELYLQLQARQRLNDKAAEVKETGSAGVQEGNSVA